MSSLHGGETTSVQGIIVSGGFMRPRFGRSFYEAILKDDSGLVRCRWFSAQYLADQLKVGDPLVVFGRVSRHKGQPIFQHPEFEVAKNDVEESIHVGRIVPVYTLTEHLPQRTIRRIVWNAVHLFAASAQESLPEETLQRLRLPGIRHALEQVHFPDTLERARSARYRLVFEEFLCVQLVLVARKVHAERFLVGTAHEAPGHFRSKFISSLPFALTDAQRKVLKEIEADMRKPRPMHRLLQGDVGSGKTVVAACAILDAIECGSQCAVMAPTEILAVQHYKTFQRYLEPMGIRIVLLTSELPAAERAKALDGLRNGDAHLVVGTHAIIEERVVVRKLGLIVIDEQHKFGVEQRGALYGKGVRPDVLVMTATPIPRTLAMTIYGDLDVSILDEMPNGRREIITRVIKEDTTSAGIRFYQEAGGQRPAGVPGVSARDRRNHRRPID